MFILLAEDATPIQPTESPFNLPALRLDDKFTLCYGALHDIDDDAKPALGKFDKPALVALIHEDSVQPWEAPFGFMKNVLGTITIRIDAAQTTTKRMRPSVSVRRWRLRPLICLCGLNPFSPPISVVATLWLSIMATLGSGSRPALRRTSRRNSVLMRSSVPSFRHVR